MSDTKDVIVIALVVVFFLSLFGAMFYSHLSEQEMRQETIRVLVEQGVSPFEAACVANQRN